MILFFSSPINGNSQVVSSNQIAASPNAETIAVISKVGQWTVQELNQIALEFLWSKGSMPKGLKVQTVVHILPDNKNTMCRFMYTQGFEKEVWTVNFGYDGKVKTFEKNIAIEGGSRNFENKAK